MENLVKHRSGGYYARLSVGGKERWTSLRTKVLEVAKARLREQQRDAARMEPIARPAKSARMTVAMAIERIMSDGHAQIPMRRLGRKIQPFRPEETSLTRRPTSARERNDSVGAASRGPDHRCIDPPTLVGWK